MKNNKKLEKTKDTFVYIDNENVNVSVMKQGWKLDREKLYKWLIKEFGATRIKMFMGWHPDYQQMYEFFDAIGYELIFRKMNINDSVPLKGNIDTELVLEAMKDFTTYDKAIIMSGDGDFACLVDHLHKHKKLKVLIVPNKHRYSDLLNDVLPAKIILTLTNKKKLLSYNPKESHGVEYSELGDEEESTSDEPQQFWL